MASKLLEMGLIMVFVAVLCGGAAAQSSSGCTSVLMSLSPCLNYITGNSSSPTASCCSQLANVVQGSPQCLCSALNSGGASVIGLGINRTLALSLPGACNVQTPPISQCNSSATTQATSPVTSPTGSPADETPTGVADTPAASETPSATAGTGNTGSKTVPSATAGSSTGSIASVPFHVVLFLVFVSTFASTITKF